jgi:hypothetical protein
MLRALTATGGRTCLAGGKMLPFGGVLTKIYNSLFTKTYNTLVYLSKSSPQMVIQLPATGMARPTSVGQPSPVLS